MNWRARFTASCCERPGLKAKLWGWNFGSKTGVSTCEVAWQINRSTAAGTPRPMILRCLYRAHRGGHVAARAHPIPELVEVIPLATLELGGAHAIHDRRSTGPNLLPRLTNARPLLSCETTTSRRRASMASGSSRARTSSGGLPKWRCPTGEVRLHADLTILAKLAGRLDSERALPLAAEPRLLATSRCTAGCALIRA